MVLIYLIIPVGQSGVKNLKIIAHSDFFVVTLQPKS